MRAHQAAVWRYLRFLGAAPDEADDLTQETFVAVLHRDLESWPGAEALAYLRRVARNALLRRLERASREPRVDLEFAEEAYAWYAAADDGRSTTRRLEQCLAELPERSRRALELKFTDGLDRADIAARLGIGAFAVKSLLARTYARLRVCIERRRRDDPD